eukprot:985779-Rhodomonas_salina.1
MGQRIGGIDLSATSPSSLSLVQHHPVAQYRPVQTAYAKSVEHHPVAQYRPVRMAFAMSVPQTCYTMASAFAYLSAVHRRRFALLVSQYRMRAIPY